ncbi:MAG: hypothetical protein LBV69_03655 [Bacteroidales bacterium]|jgi:hypothetical protein|nr:hypothetical protein [Bacteroidales bacterium]
MNIFNIGREGKGFVIGIEKTAQLGDIKKIDKFLNIVYEGEKTGIDEKGNKYNFHQIRFLEGDENLANYLFSMLEDDKEINNSMSFVGIVEYIASLFRNHSTEKTIQKLIGDIGEVLFILLLERNNVN